jgi:predicted HTH transcriptional regulator
VFDFYRRVVNKLTADLKVPFVLKDGLRQDDTPTHKALREALVNTLVHADFTGRLSVLVVKEPAGFSFRNPGGMRVPAALALQGGVSDCRNRTMQQMFLMIGLGERAGSGMSRILHGWQDLGHGVRLLERYEPQEHSVLEMTWRDELVPKGSPESSPESSPQNSLKTEERVLQLLRDTPSMTTQALGERLGISKRGVLKQVEKLKEQGRLRRVGPNKGGHWEVLEP